MECKFQAGDEVICIEEWLEHTRSQLGLYGPVLDERYTISSVVMSVCLCCHQLHPFVTLRQIVHPLGYFDHEMFRKLLTIDDFKSADIDAPVDRIKEPETVT